MADDATNSIVVVGGGPAGAITALLAARAGSAVELLERSAGPHDKVCGECLSNLGQTVLTRAGLLDSFLAVSPARLTHAEFWSRGGSCCRIALPRPSMGITRRSMDAILLDAASAAGVTVRRSVRCEKVVPGNPPAIEWRNLKSNQTGTARPNVIVLADGKGQLAGRVIAPTGDLGIKGHFRHDPDSKETIALYSGRGWYVGVAAVEGGLTNVAMSVGAARLREYAGDLHAVVAAAATECRPFARRLAAMEQVKRWIASPLPRFAVDKLKYPGVFVAGNAAAAIEPIGGEGMGAALRSGELVLSTIFDRHNADDKANSLRSLYARRRSACRSLAWVFTKPPAVRTMMPVFRMMPFAASIALRMVGK